jgi:hypothetical protein
MTHYRDKSYGRNEEVAILYANFVAGRDISMHGPRRLGKTFLLDRLVDAAPTQNWIAAKVELAGCVDTRAVFRELCAGIGSKRSGGQKAINWITQRLSQAMGHRSEQSGPWYQGLLSVDYESNFERVLGALNDDKKNRWLLLIDELPIFLKALHDAGPNGIANARNFMNMLSRLRQQSPNVRWMITGSIGIDPLAQAGNYLGVLAKFQNFELHPLTTPQAKDFVQDQAIEERLLHRKTINDAEAEAIVATVGWRAAYYLEAVAQKLQGPLADSPAQAQQSVEAAVVQLLQPSERSIFGPWEEHLRKHYLDTDCKLAFGVLKQLAATPQGDTLDTLLATLNRPALTRAELRALLIRLHTEGFITVDDWDHDSAHCTFRNPLLRRWWQRYQPTA